MGPVYPSAPPVADADVPPSESPIVDLPPPPPPPPLASGWLRVEDALVEIVLFVCTLGIGWLVWWIVAWARGDTPAKQILALRVVRAGDRQLASFGQMAVREVVGRFLPFAVGAVAYVFARDGAGAGAFVVGFVAAYFAAGFGFLFADGARQAPWDKLANTVVIAPRPVPGGEGSATPPEASTDLR